MMGDSRIFQASNVRLLPAEITIFGADGSMTTDALGTDGKWYQVDPAPAARCRFSACPLRLVAHRHDADGWIGD